MNKYKTIIVDTLGSDKGPENVTKGVCQLINENEDVFVKLVGPTSILQKVLQENNIKKERYQIIDTDDTITNYDKVADAFFNKANTSVSLAVKELAKDENSIGLLTPGNSGAILMSSLKYLMTPEMTRPCMAAFLPAETGDFVCLLDTGANVDCTVSQLHEFARLGSKFYSQLYRVKDPKVGLLSNGVEPTKGNKLIKETHQILANDTTINFVGNIEGNRALSGDCQVLVCDGFAGNQVLKVTEGTCARLIKDIVKYSKKNNMPQLMPLVGYLMSTYDISSLGGAIVLGVKKPIIKCRGNSDSITFVNTGKMLLNLENGKTFFEGKDNRNI